ncbi:hypothetical protein DL93DRAFT_1899368 [Clavulina sp. PMI_390]|nr:hypothetical protein DL93DRAFT_1899368 [Clavulina sp. PMI_390]
MGKRQKQQMIKYAENHHIEMFPLSITIRPPAIDPNATQRPGGIPPSRSQSDGARSNIPAWPASDPPLGNTYGNAPLPNSIQTSFAAPYQQSFQISSPTQQNSPLSRRISLDSPSTLNVGSTMAHASPLTALDQSSYWSSLPQQEARSANTPISSLPARPSWSTAIATNQATITAAGASATLATTASGPVRTGSTLPVTFEEYKTLGEQRKYAVARYLLSVGESGRGNVQRLPGATDEDEKRLYNEYLANPAMRAEVKTLVDSKIIRIMVMVRLMGGIIRRSKAEKRGARDAQMNSMG